MALKDEWNIEERNDRTGYSRKGTFRDISLVGMPVDRIKKIDDECLRLDVTRGRYMADEIDRSAEFDDQFLRDLPPKVRRRICSALGDFYADPKPTPYTPGQMVWDPPGEGSFADFLRDSPTSSRS